PSWAWARDDRVGGMRTSAFPWVLAVVGGCAGAPLVSEPGGPRICHTILFHVHDWAPDDTQKRLADDLLAAASSVPGLVLLHVGGPLVRGEDPDTAAADTGIRVVERGFDVCATLLFEDAAALAAWQDHPAHRALRERLATFLERVVVLDAAAGVR